MAILDFISQDDLENLDDDPRMAFLTFVDHAKRSLAEQSKGLDPQNESQWEQREELRHSFMNVVIAAAKRFEIEPFLSMAVPRMSTFTKRGDLRDFMADLDHYITQLVLDRSMRSKYDSVSILPGSKDRIRSYVHALRQCVEQANMTEPKRDALLNKLNQFEEELEKRRLNILAVARVVFELLAIPGTVWASAEVTNKLITNVMQVVAEAKSAEQETQRLAPMAPPKELSPPRTEEPISGLGSDSDSNIIDEDIPF